MVASKPNWVEWLQSPPSSFIQWCSRTTHRTRTGWAMPGCCWPACSTHCLPTVSPQPPWMLRSRWAAGGWEGNLGGDCRYLLQIQRAAMQHRNMASWRGCRALPLFSARLLLCCSLAVQVAGYRMHHVYHGQFTKLLQYIDREFLPNLGTSKDPDARAVYTR